MIMAVNEARHDRHPPGIVPLGRLTDESANLRGRPDGCEAASFDGKCLRLRRLAVDGVNLGIQDDQIGILCFGSERWAKPWPAGGTADDTSHHRHQSPTCV